MKIDSLWPMENKSILGNFAKGTSLIGLAILLTEFVSGCSSSETYNRLEAYYLETKGNELLIKKATDVLGDDWSRICIINKYSDDVVIQNAIGREFSLIEKLHWLYISKIADFSEQSVLIYEISGDFIRMEPPLSRYIDSENQSDRVTKERAVCLNKENLYIRRRKQSSTLEFFFKK